jgi:hypothetical protein
VTAPPTGTGGGDSSGPMMLGVLLSMGGIALLVTGLRLARRRVD